MLARGQVDHVKAERNALAGIDNPYVVKLFYSFQVSNFIYHDLQNMLYTREWIGSL